MISEFECKPKSFNYIVNSYMCVLDSVPASVFTMPQLQEIFSDTNLVCPRPTFEEFVEAMVERGVLEAADEVGGALCFTLPPLSPV